MKTDIINSNCTVIDVKSEPTEILNVFPKQEPATGYPHIEVDHNNAENAVFIKEVQYVDDFVPRSNIELDPVGVTQNISSTEIPPKEIKSEMELGDDNELLHFLFSNKNPDELEVACKSCLQSSEIGHPCEICKKSVSIPIYLTEHMKLYGEEQSQDESSLEAFQRNVGERIHKCEICIKYFKRREDLSRHLNIHTGEKNYECEICNKCFTRKDHVSNHMKIHTGEKNHKCDICTKSFRRNVDLSRHASKHTNERNYECEICTKRFKRKEHLLKHVKMHLGARNHECEICCKCFTTKQHLLGHLKVHTGERNFKCEICEKLFTRKQNLTKHMKTHTGVENYKCEICSRRFKWKRDLLFHMNTHTTENSYKREILWKHKSSGEESSKEKIIRKFPYDTRASKKGQFIKRFIKEETSVFINEEKFKIDTSSIERKPSIDSSESGKNFKFMAPSQQNEIIIKEENIMDAL